MSSEQRWRVALLIMWIFSTTIIVWPQREEVTSIGVLLGMAIINVVHMVTLLIRDRRRVRR